MTRQAVTIATVIVSLFFLITALLQLPGASFIYRNSTPKIKKPISKISNIKELGIKDKCPVPPPGKVAIVIVKSDNSLYLYNNQRLVKKYRVATGENKNYTPEGHFQIVNKIKDPDRLKPELGPR